MSMQSRAPRPIVECPICRQVLQSVGRLPVRRDTLEHRVVSFAQPGDGQAVVGIDLYRCPNCGRLETYDHDFLLPGA